MVELVPFPFQKHKKARMATALYPFIEQHGAAYVAEERIQQMSHPGSIDSLTSRINRNTALAFSKQQLRTLIRRELIEITGRSWKFMRKP